jgi:transcriptional regulator NrdR family protein
MTAYADGNQIVRRRHCQGCEHRWYTLQAPELRLSSDAFRWIEKAGRRRTVKLLEPGQE